ncbi:neuropeptide CCHamide 1 isoform X1 [Nomia melanderi]|uniref:neuropeptide CCHamide 1 isoform X1 n=1 Tax=Nomia melanderi TaxID=2448451 RepID=UPI003FCEA94F
MAVASENSVTIFIRTWTFMIIFCFAGNAAGSCLSYGHSCWGGHGKRSGGHNNAYFVSTKTMDDLQQDVPSLAKEQWVLSRLIARPLMSTKYRGRWDRPFKIKSNFPQHWENEGLNAHVNSDTPVRDENNNEDGDEGKKRNINGMEDILGSINEDRKEIPEILLISNNGDHQQERKPHNVELIKFLVNLRSINY